jgi:hypothetical protein
VVPKVHQIEFVEREMPLWYLMYPNNICPGKEGVYKTPYFSNCGKQIRKEKIWDYFFAKRIHNFEKTYQKKQKLVPRREKSCGFLR